jgi:hypothetical protein
MSTSNSTSNAALRNIYSIGSVSAILKLVAILTFSVIIGVLGEKPETAAEYFAIYEISPLQAFFRGDFFVMLLIVFYLGTIPALFMALRRISPVWMGFASLFSLITVLGAIFSESSFSLLHLGKHYVTATSETHQAALIAAGEAIIASDMWNNTAAYMGGIFLQGSGVVISIIMLRSKDFSKVTAISGLVGNALDLVQHVLHPFAPAISTPIQMFMGVFYFVWFPMLAWDLFRLARRIPKTEVNNHGG